MVITLQPFLYNLTTNIVIRTSIIQNLSVIHIILANLSDSDFYLCYQNHINSQDYAKESIIPTPCPDDGCSRSGTRD
jgi:hypothetical protein